MNRAAAHALSAAGLRILTLDRVDTPAMIDEGFDHIFVAACVKG